MSAEIHHERVLMYHNPWCFWVDLVEEADQAEGQKVQVET